MINKLKLLFQAQPFEDGFFKTISNCCIERIDVINSIKGYGLKSSTSIKRNMSIIQVPFEVWKSTTAQISVKRVASSFPQLLNKLLEMSTNLQGHQQEKFIASTCIALGIMLDSNAQQPSCYIKFLRHSTYPCNENAIPHPLLLQTEDLDLLEGTSAFNTINARRNHYKKIADALFQGENDFKSFDQNFHSKQLSFLWAMSMIQSRAVSGPDWPMTLVPGLDLANHSSEPAPNLFHEYDAVRRCFHLVTSRDVEAGEDLCISYGEGRSSASTLALYGFVDPLSKCQNDMFELRIPTSIFSVAVTNSDESIERLVTTTINNENQPYTTITFGTPLGTLLEIHHKIAGILNDTVVDSIFDTAASDDLACVAASVLTTPLNRIKEMLPPSSAEGNPGKHSRKTDELVSVIILTRAALAREQRLKSNLTNLKKDRAGLDDYQQSPSKWKERWIGYCQTLVSREQKGWETIRSLCEWYYKYKRRLNEIR